MNKRKSSPHQDYLDAKAIEAALDAQSLPPGPERTKGPQKSGKVPQRGGLQLSLLSLFRRTQAAFRRTQAARIIKFTFVLLCRNESPAPAWCMQAGQIAGIVQCPTKMHSTSIQP